MFDWHLVSSDPDIQAHYEHCRMLGTSHSLAEQFALGVSPRVNGTDAAFNHGRCNGNQFAGNERLGEAFAADAKAAGVSTKGKTYLHGLAEYPGDPRAWVSDLHDARKVVEDRGWGADGMLNVKSEEPADAPKFAKVSPAIIEREAGRYMAQNQTSDKEAAKEAVTEVLQGAY